MPLAKQPTQISIHAKHGGLAVMKRLGRETVCTMSLSSTLTRCRFPKPKTRFESAQVSTSDRC